MPQTDRERQGPGNAGKQRAMMTSSTTSWLIQFSDAQHDCEVEGHRDDSATGRTPLPPCRDRDLNTFALAEGAFYHFGLLAMPKHARALLNWALVLEHVRRDPAQAGKCVDPYHGWRHVPVCGFRIWTNVPCSAWGKMGGNCQRDQPDS